MTKHKAIWGRNPDTPDVPVMVRGRVGAWSCSCGRSGRSASSWMRHHYHYTVTKGEDGQIS